MNKEQQKRVAAIHDLSGFGKCSLTVALPILSAAGIETSALPTAILSTHTGGILGYTYRDLTKGMRSLCERADIIVPNLTEAALLLGEPYQAGPYTKAYIDGILHKLSQLGPKQVVLTGVYFDEKELGAATFDMERNATEYVLTEKIPGYYHGTGDVFASALLSGLLNNFNLERSAEIAVRFTAESILRTFKAQTDYRFGVNFEQSIPDLLKELKLI